MPTYQHLCEKCKHEFEDVYSMTAAPPKTCPKCGEDAVKRLISLSGKGVVELYGQDLVDKVKSDARKLKADAAKSEKIYSNLLGDDKYNGLQKRIDRQKR